MLIIRLIRTGKKNAPNFRVVLIEKTAPPKSGKFLEILGNYNPRLSAKDGSPPKADAPQERASGKKEITLNKERIEYWLSQGVKPSLTVHNLLVSQGIIKGPKIKKKFRIKKKGRKIEETEEKKEKLVEKEKKESKPTEKEETKADQTRKEEKSELKEETKDEDKPSKRKVKKETLDNSKNKE